MVLEPVSQRALERQQDPLETNVHYHKGVVKVNQRITAADWDQEVRHIEIELEDDVQSVCWRHISDLGSVIYQDRRHDPGDVAVIHPHAAADDVNALLDIMDWSEIADGPFKIERNMCGRSTGCLPCVTL